ncbi:hypothetical protein BGZ63DRAFT_379501 [Mariannaea sp. PMI_226]|nr:hypothetical protein BGZ63DRAFT_379501 [Mariannaea sp. PMI_226]
MSSSGSERLDHRPATTASESTSIQTLCRLVEAEKGKTADKFKAMVDQSKRRDEKAAATIQKNNDRQQMKSQMISAGG